MRSHKGKSSVCGALAPRVSGAVCDGGRDTCYATVEPPRSAPCIRTLGGPASTHPSSKLLKCRRQVGGSRREAFGRSRQRGILGRGGLAQYGRGAARAEGTALGAGRRRRAGAQGRALCRQPRGGARSLAVSPQLVAGAAPGASSACLSHPAWHCEAHDSCVVPPGRDQPSPRPGTRPQFLPWQVGAFRSAIPPSTADTTAQPARRERPLQSFPGKKPASPRRRLACVRREPAGLPRWGAHPGPRSGPRASQILTHLFRPHYRAVLAPIPQLSKLRRGELRGLPTVSPLERGRVMLLIKHYTEGLSSRPTLGQSPNRLMAPRLKWSPPSALPGHFPGTALSCAAPRPSLTGGAPAFSRRGFTWLASCLSFLI